MPQLKARALQGNAEAQYDLGMAYLNGVGVEENYPLAFEWIKKSAGKGFNKGYYQFGEMYCQGIGCERNYKEALNYFRKADETGVKNAKFTIAQLIGRGYDDFAIPELNVYVSLPEQETFEAHKAQITNYANHDDPYAWFYLAMFNDSKTDRIRCLEKSFNLFFDKEGKERIDYISDSYESYYSRYKSLNITICSPQDFICDCLGWCYQFGMGVKKDLNKAIYYYRIPMNPMKEEFGEYFRETTIPHPYERDGETRVALCYKELGDLKKYGELIDSIRFNPPAFLLAGERYFKGIGTSTNYKKAKEYFEKVIDFECNLGSVIQFYPHTYADACYRLYQMYSNGLGCVKNTKMANLCFDDALKYGSTSALYDDQANYERKYGKGILIQMNTFDERVNFFYGF